MNEIEKNNITNLLNNVSLISKLETDNQINNIDFDDNNNLIINESFKSYLNTLNDFQKFEIERFL